MSKSKTNERKIVTGIGPATDKLIGTVVDKITSADFQNLFEDKVVDPVLEVVSKKARPYIYLGIACYIVVFLMLCFIIYLLLKNNKHQ